MKLQFAINFQILNTCEKFREFELIVICFCLQDDLDDHAMGAKVTDMSFRSDKFLRVTTETASRNPDQTMQEVTSVKCPKAQKEYFTVIKNVKQVHSEKYINHHNNNQLFVFTYFVYTFCLHRLIKFKILESSKNLMTMLSTSWKDYKRK